MPELSPNIMKVSKQKYVGSQKVMIYFHIVLLAKIML